MIILIRIIQNILRLNLDKKNKHIRLMKTIKVTDNLKELCMRIYKYHKINCF